MASDRLARELLNMTTDPNVSDPVKLAAIKDALDRGGIQSKNAVSVEVGITKPFEAVFDSIISGPRDSAASPALAALECPGEDTEVIEGEYDDDPFPEDDEVIHSGYTDAEPDVIDVEIEAIGSGPPHTGRSEFVAQR